jgi:hypothetical protein
MPPKKHRGRAERLAEMQQAARERTLREKTPRFQLAKELQSLRRRVEKLERKESLRSIRESNFKGLILPQKSRPRALTKEELDRKWCEENGVRYEDTEAAKQGSPIQIRKSNLLEVKNSGNKKV